MSKSMEFILFFCKPKKLKKHESNFYEAVKLSKSLKTASKDPVLVPGKCSSFWTESGRHQFQQDCTGEMYRKSLQEELSALNSAELIKIMQGLGNLCCPELPVLNTQFLRFLWQNVSYFSL